MSDMTRLLECIKRASVEAVQAAMPAGIAYGTVTGTSPLTVQIEQKHTLGPAQLVLTRNVTDHTVAVTVSHQTEEADAGEVHRHAISGTGSVTVHSALQVGERVLLFQEQGGQRYIILDRVVTT